MQEKKTSKRAEEKPYEEWFYWLQTLVTAVECIVLAFTLLGRLTRVVGHSMDPTLTDGEMLLVWSLGYEPKQGDIVIANKTSPLAAETLGGEAIVKRVIAVGGQTVEVDYDNNTVYVDGEPLEEDYILEEMRWTGNPYMQETWFEVPEGEVFLMGDNRNGSSDSRDERIGCVDSDYLLGKAVFVLFPFSSFGFL